MKLNAIDFFKGAISVFGFCLLAACGGGGSDGGVSTPIPITTTPTTTTVTPTVAPVSLSGVLTYDKIGSTASGALNYSGITAAPIRGATVQLLSSGGAVLATALSDANGAYSFASAPANSNLTVRVRAELKQTTGAAQWDVQVVDNTAGQALYVLDAALSTGSTAAVRNAHANSGWNGVAYGSVRNSAPFSILDVVYQAQAKVLSANASTVFPPVKLNWSVNNQPAGSNPALGQIGTSYFQNTSAGRNIYILGAANVDTDENDASVIAHEWGHYYEDALSRSDSIGGSHGGSDDRLDFRVAFGEGFGNAWAGIVTGTNSYKDSSGTGQALGFSIALNSGYAGVSTPKGWFREQSVAYILWDLNRQLGFAPIHNALTSSTYKSNTALSGIHSFAAAMRSIATSAQITALNALLSAETISTTSDAYGNTETNNGGINVALPIYRQATALGSPVTLSAGQTLCSSTSFDPTNVRNKLGRYVLMRFTVPTAGNKTITVSQNSASVDPDFFVYNATGQYDYSAGAGTSEAKTTYYTAGNYVLAIQDFEGIDAAPCFTVSIN